MTTKNKTEIEMWVEKEQYGLEYLTPNPKYKTYNFNVKLSTDKKTLTVTEKTRDFRGGCASISFTIKNAQEAEKIINSITTIMTI